MDVLSVTGKKWIYKNSDTDKIRKIKETFNLDEISAKLISQRNIELNELSNFINPQLKNTLPNPNILKDMDKSVLKTVDLIKKNKRLGLFGDYDVDGASSAALLASYFNCINRQYEIYIPNRKLEGYGPSIKGFEKLIKKKVDLIFTVDCGTLSYGPISFAKKKGIDVIVLDHHQCEIKLPDAHSIINPNRLDDESDLKYLCASGVTFLFLIALNKHLREINYFDNIKEPDLLQLLDLVSLGTICDVVPLVGLNRVFVKQGLKILNKKNNLGIKNLINISKIENTTTTYHIGYQLGPRINAGGRVGKSSHGVNLLLNPSPRKLSNSFGARSI